MQRFDNKEGKKIDPAQFGGAGSAKREKTAYGKYSIKINNFKKFLAKSAIIEQNEAFHKGIE